LKPVKRVTVCGGGNAAHVAIPLLKNNGIAVKLYTPFSGEAKAFKKGASAGGITLVSDGSPPITGAPDTVTTDPQEAANADLILLLLPAFAHGSTLESLAPYLDKEVTIGAIPTRSGFELQAARHLDIHAGGQTIFCGQTLPWACRIIEQGRQVKVLGIKARVGMAAVPAAAAAELCSLLSRALNVNFVPMAGSLAASLGNVGQVIHPGIMFGLLKNYDGEVWSETEIPLFYQGVTEEIATLLENLSAEILQAAAMLTKRFNLDLSEVISIKQWLFDSYSASIEDKSSLARAFCTNHSYRGLKIPVVAVDKGFVPDFNSRYLTEDIPYGLLYSRAVAGLVGSPTPQMNKVIKAASSWIGKSYLGQDGSLTGPDIKEARIPQNYGINDPDRLVKVSEGI